MAQVIPHRLLLIALIMFAIIAIDGHQASAALTAAQKAKANAALLGLWTHTDGMMALGLRGPKVNVTISGKFRQSWRAVRM